MVTWVVHCPECHEQIDKALNGELMNAVATKHADETGHRPILGFFVEPAPNTGTVIPAVPRLRGLV